MGSKRNNTDRITLLELDLAKFRQDMEEYREANALRFGQVMKAIIDLSTKVRSSSDKEDDKKSKNKNYKYSLRSEFEKRHAEVMKLLQQRAQASKPPLTPTRTVMVSTQPFFPSSDPVFDEHESPIPPFHEANGEKVGRQPISGLSDMKPVITPTIVNEGKQNKEERENEKKVLLIEEKRGSIGGIWSSKDIVDEGGYQATKIFFADHSEKLGFHVRPNPTPPNGDFLYFFYPPCFLGAE